MGNRNDFHYFFKIVMGNGYKFHYSLKEYWVLDMSSITDKKKNVNRYSHIASSPISQSSFFKGIRCLILARRNWTLATINPEPDPYCLPSARSTNLELDRCYLRLVRSAQFRIYNIYLIKIHVLQVQWKIQYFFIIFTDCYKLRTIFQITRWRLFSLIMKFTTQL